jgi:hypothetical protein
MHKQKSNFSNKKDFIYRKFRILVLSMRIAYKYRVIYCNKRHGGKSLQERSRIVLRHHFTFGARMLGGEH